MSSPTQITQFDIPPGFIDLGLGDPQLSLLPRNVLRRAAEERFGKKDSEFLQYGIEQGDGTFRSVLAAFLSRAYLTPVEADSLFITNGASMGLHLICTFFTRPGDTVFVEEPTYFLALRIFADHGLKLVPVRTDENGLVIEDLEEKLVASHPKFLYVIPTFQNPTGQTMPVDRRKRLVSLSQKNDFLIVADEVYHCLNYAGKVPTAFAAFPQSGNVISLGSFSKILSPGLRLGWIQANGKIIRRLVDSGLLDSGGGMNPFSSGIVRQVIENGSLEENIARLISVYSKRVLFMETALRDHLPQLEFNPPKGGYFFWIHLPGGINAAEFLRKAEAFKVGFRPGSLFSCQDGMKDFMRLSFVFYDPSDLEQGVIRIKKSLDHLNY